MPDVDSASSQLQIYEVFVQIQSRNVSRSNASSPRWNPRCFTNGSRDCVDRIWTCWIFGSVVSMCGFVSGKDSIFRISVQVFDRFIISSYALSTVFFWRFFSWVYFGVNIFKFLVWISEYGISFYWNIIGIWTPHEFCNFFTQYLEVNSNNFHFFIGIFFQ